MTFDWSNIPEQRMEHFKGGEKAVYVRAFANDQIRIMMGRMPVGATIGLHTHETNSETCYIVSGVARFFVNGVPEVVPAGQAHHCPQGCTHACENAGEEDMIMFCVIPEHGGETK